MKIAEASDVMEYLTEDGRSPFGEWFEALEVAKSSKIVTAITRMKNGNMSNVRPVGSGVYENKIDFGPGYRIYFGNDGRQLIILLAGGTKRGQSRDIDRAKGYWKDYKNRKRRG